MHAFSGAFSIELLDGLACGLLAASAAFRAKKFGAALFGGLLLGCLCGLAGSLARELILHGTGHIVMRLDASPACLGALAGLAAAFAFKKLNLFLWLDGCALGLAASLGCALAAPELTLGAALCVGLINALLPGIIRDVALGDTTMLAEKSWYGASCAIGCIVALCALMLPVLAPTPAFYLKYLGECAVLAGTLTTLGIRVAAGRKELE